MSRHPKECLIETRMIAPFVNLAKAASAIVRDMDTAGEVARVRSFQIELTAPIAGLRQIQLESRTFDTTAVSGN
jgi:hypothetical protein